MTTDTKQELLPAKFEVEAFSQFRADLVVFKKEQSSIVFDYDTAAGEKDARSHMHKLRLSKGAVERARVSEKSDILERGRSIDAAAKDITAELDGMIDVHAQPLKEKADREQERVDGIKLRLQGIVDARGIDYAEYDTPELLDCLKAAHLIVVDDTFEEFALAAQAERDETVRVLTNAVTVRQKYDLEQAELAQLRANEAERIEREATEKATREANEKKERERVAAETAARETVEREQAERLNNERIERERVAAEEQADRDRIADEEKAASNERERILRDERAAALSQAAAETAARELAEKKAIEATAAAERQVKDKAAAEVLATERREQDKRHRGKINTAALNALIENGIKKDDAKRVVELIASKEIPNVAISY